MSPKKSAASPPHVHPYVILTICCASLLLIGMDVTIVNVALPAIQVGLHASLAGLQWVVDAYTLTLASLLIFSGSMADRYGRRRVFQIGLTVFCIGSLFCSLTHSIGGLIAYRVLQGLGATMLNPVALSIIAHVFQEPKERVRVIGIWGAMMGISLAIGPVLGGALTQTIGWRSIFWINLPICVAAVALTARFVPESKAAHRRAFDPVGQILALAILLSLTYAIIESPHDGWASAPSLVLFAVAALCVILFLVYEPRCREPLLNPRFFHSVPFTGAFVLALLCYSSYAGFLFLNTLYLQQERGYSALQTGLCTLPFAVMITILAPVSGSMVGHFGPRPSIVAGSLGFLLSALLLTPLSLGTPILQLMLAYALFGIGLGMINPAITNNAVSGMPLAQAGVASAIASTSRQVGTALGVALAGAIVSTGSARGISFTQATHPIWWMMTVGFVIVLLLGWVTTTCWALRSTSKVASLFPSAEVTAAK
jgi:EmrB/QacA subfamily drug resistance transporter